MKKFVRVTSKAFNEGWKEGLRRAGVQIETTKEQMTLKFSDGIEIDTSGELRKMHLHDGWYVVGKGMLMPCRDEVEADRMLAQENTESKHDK